MGLAERVGPYQEHPYRGRQESSPRPGQPRRPADPGAALDRQPVAMSGRELVPMAGVVLVVCAVLALLLMYLTAFGRLTAQGAYSQRLSADIRELESTRAGLAGELVALSKTDRIAREARVMGLQPVAPAQTHAIPNQLTEAGGAPAATPTAPARQ